jgi:hypothetical protein
MNTRTLHWIWLIAAAGLVTALVRSDAWTQGGERAARPLFASERAQLAAAGDADASAIAGCGSAGDCARPARALRSPEAQRRAALERRYAERLAAQLDAERSGTDYELLDLLAEVRESELSSRGKIRIYRMLLERGETLAQAAELALAKRGQDWVCTAVHAIARADLAQGAALAAQLITRHREDAAFQSQLLGSVGQHYLASAQRSQIPADLAYMRRELLARAQQGVLERRGLVDPYHSRELALHAIDLGRVLDPSKQAVMDEIVDTLEAFSRRGADPVAFFDGAVSSLGPFDAADRARLKRELLARFPQLVAADVDARLRVAARGSSRPPTRVARPELQRDDGFAPVRVAELPTRPARGRRGPPQR